MLAEGDDLVAGDDVLAVGKRKELQRLTAFPCRSCRRSRTITLLTPSDRGLQDGLHLPHAVLVVAPVGLEESVDRFLGGRGGGEVGRIGLGEDWRPGWGGRFGWAAAFEAPALPVQAH